MKEKRKRKKVENSELLIVADTSVIVDGRITRLIAKHSKDSKIKVVIPEAVIAELENQANQGRESGFSGLDELERLKKYKENGKAELVFHGKRPSSFQLKDIDDIIRKTAQEVGAILVTSDRVQARVASAKGIKVKYLAKKRAKKKLRILDFFDENTMSVHLKESAFPFAKVGKPGDIKLIKLSDRKIRRNVIQSMAREIIEFAKADAESFIELERKGATVVQLRDIRICIARPPFSDGFEITAVKPIAKVSLRDYELSEKLIKRLDESAEGILIAGPPGAGKSTFAQALAEFYKDKGKIVKTMESPRDLVLSSEITQYSPLEGRMEKTADVLLLVRPDYTVYDELRKTSDFNIFADMRLAGVGMIGVVHATRAIDALQRILKRVELGVLPQIIDTVIFIKNGKIEKVYSVVLTVKLPSGFHDEELSRPVIEVRDFETGKAEYEIYTFGDETIVMPVKKEEKTAIERLAEKKIAERIKKAFPKANAEVEVKGNKAIIFIEDRYIPAIIGRKGKNIERLERELGIRIQINPIATRKEEAEEIIKREKGGKEVNFGIEETEKHVYLIFDRKLRGKNIAFYVNSEVLFFATVGRKGDIKIDKKSEIAKKIISAISENKNIKALVA